MFNKIKAIKDLRDQAKTMQKQLAEIHIDGSGAKGMVKMRMNGNQELEGIHIDDALLSDKTRLENGIKEAFENTIKDLHKELASKMKDMQGFDALKNLGL